MDTARAPARAAHEVVGGWPDRLLSQWQRFQWHYAEREKGRLTRGLVIPRARQIELFMRELLLTRDAETLRLAAQTTWRDDRGEVQTFPILDLPFAVRSGDAATVCVAFECATTPVSSETCQRLWHEAMSHFPGHCRVLDVLERLTAPREDLYQYYKDHSTNAHVVAWMARRLGAAPLVDKLPPAEPMEVELPPVQALPPVEPMEIESPCMIFAPPFRILGNAAFRVLTNRELFLLLPQWTVGWPTRVATRWHELSAQTTVAEADAAVTSTKRKVRLFTRALLLQGDIETLRLVGQCQWKGSTEATPRRFPVKDVAFAVRSGHAETLQWALQAVRDAGNWNMFTFPTVALLWHDAMAEFPGHCGVANVLYESLPPPLEMWIAGDDEAKVMATTRGLVDRMGAAAVPSLAIDLAAIAGNLALVQYLATVPGQNIAFAAKNARNIRGDIYEFLQTLI